MRIDELRARLQPLPTRLPPSRRELTPTVIDSGAGGPVASPQFPDVPRRRAAVLILFHPGPDGEALLTLTERSPGGHRHAGEISLPGGAIDEGDESAIAAALREAHEEVGLDPEQAGLSVLGTLPMVDVAVSGFLVNPVVAFADRTPMLTPDGYEVARIVTAEFAAFLPGADVETMVVDRDGYRLRYGGYRIGAHHVWGATAFLLSRLGGYVAGATSAVRAPGA